MKKNPNNCQPEVLSLYHDGELSPEEKGEILIHLEKCPTCRKRLKEMETVSTLLESYLDEELSRTNTQKHQNQILEKIRDRRDSVRHRVEKIPIKRKILFPALAMVAILVFLFTTLKQPEPVPAPTAIINSFTGNVSSVMIIETPRTRQTIIWYAETQDLSGQSR